MTHINFTKMVATGNDFIVIDNRPASCVLRPAHLAKRLCDRRFGIGADGVLLIEKSKSTNFKMRIFNPDGSEAEMCGNGIRCIALYAFKNKIAPKDMCIETKAGILSAQVKGALVKINMIDPKEIKLSVDIDFNNKTYGFSYVNTGVPHVVCFVKNIDDIDVEKIGRFIRYHKAFRSKGVNVDFVQIKGKDKIFMRAYERGVEAETLACGTGATASAIMSAILKGFSSPVKVFTRGGELNIYFKRSQGKFKSVFLEGPACEVFKGKISV